MKISGSFPCIFFQRSFLLLLVLDTVDPNAQDSSGRTALSHGTEMHEVEVVRVLMEPERIEPNRADKDGWTLDPAHKHVTAFPRRTIFLQFLSNTIIDDLLIRVSWSNTPQDSQCGYDWQMLLHSGVEAQQGPWSLPPAHRVGR